MGADDAWRRTPDIDARLIKPIGMSDLQQLIEAGKVSSDLAGHRKPTAGPPTISRRVLLAEYNVVNQILARRILESAGHLVVVVSDDRQTVDAWDNDDFDLILMDMQMPVMDGLTACLEIRERESLRAYPQPGTRQRIPIVALTARAMPEDHELCLSAGMDGFLTKPIKRAELLAAVAGLAVAVPVLTSQ
jgi:CheY-like chemotaxis protein